jgi:hypothetical protein
MLTIAGILASIATVVGGVIWAFKWIVIKTMTTPEQRDAATDKKIADEKDAVKKGGRPSWD